MNWRELGARPFGIGIFACYAGFMKYFFLLLGAALAWGQLQTPPPPADPVVITIGEEKITKSQFEQIISTFPEQQRAQLQTGLPLAP